jgi:hypothetical protein
VLERGSDSVTCRDNTTNVDSRRNVSHSHPADAIRLAGGVDWSHADAQFRAERKPHQRTIGVSNSNADRRAHEHCRSECC